MVRAALEVRLPPLAVDGLLAVGLGAAVTIAIAVSPEPNARTPDLFAFALAAAIAALVFVRRRWPLRVLMATAALLLAYYWLDYPGIAPAVPLSVALGTAAASLPSRWPIGVAAFFVVASFAGRQSPTSVVLADVVRDAALLLSVVLLGLTVRSRADRLAQAEARLRLTVERRVAEERVRIARDVHDIVGHTVAAMTVQAGLAADAFERDPAQAKQALQAVRSSGRAAMAELHSTVRVLRTAAPFEHAPGLADLGGLRERAEAAGLDCVIERTGEAGSVPALVETTLYRIAQEALTNVIKHAHAKTVRIAVRDTEDHVVLEVTDDGVGPSGSVVEGYGLTGMAERAASVGGTVTSGAGERDGFLVRAELPVGEGR